MLAAFEYLGLDPDNLYDEEVNAKTEQMQRAYSQLDKRLTAWWIVDKRRDHSYPTNEFRNATAEKLDKIYSRGFTSGKHYSIRYTFYMLFTGNTGVDKFFDRVSRIQSESNVSIGSAVMSAFKESMSGRNAFARDVGVLRENLETFERILTGFINTSPIRFTRLVGDTFSSALGTLLNRASEPASHRKPQGAMLDAWLPTNYVDTGAEVIKFRGNHAPVYAAALSVVKWPERTTPMLFETLAKMDMEMTICQIVRFMDASESNAEIDKAIEYYKLTQYGLLAHAIAKAAGKTPEAKSGKTELLEDCEYAKTRIGAEGITYAYHNLSVMVYGSSIKELNINVSLASQRMSNEKFAVIRERQNTMPTFASMLPGQWAMQTRYELVTVENVADSTPMYTMDEGDRKHDFFSSDIYKKPVPKFAVFGNSYGGRFNFAPHVGQVGHMLIIAPTGGGKTTFVNFCLSQFQRYGDVNTFIFDRNLSCRVVTELHHGRHIDIKNKNAKFNPFFAMMDGSEDGQTWVREFILRRLKEGGFDPTTDDREALDRALSMLAASRAETGEKISMSSLAAMVPYNLQKELGEWLTGRPYGMFDSEEDDFSVSNWTTIEMREIMAVERLSRAFMDYAFRKIYVSLDGRPTFIYLEEASFLLNNEAFSSMIDDWLKTFRKKNAFVWMTIQSPESVTSSEISASLLDNVFSFLLLKNPKVESHRKSYRKNFALEDHQIDMISTLQPKRDYLLVQNQQARVLTTKFTPETLAYLRSEETVLATFEKHRASGSANWHEEYLAEIASQ